MTKKMEKISRFKKVKNFEDDEKRAQYYRARMQKITNRLFALVLLNGNYYVMNHRVAVQNFKGNLVLN